jgi:hypothetical protein
MMERVIRGAALAAFVLMFVAAVPLAIAARQDVPAMSGVWKLNVEASTNPNGTPPKAPARGQRGGGDGDDAGGNLGKEEMTRFNTMKKMLWEAPPMMGIQATATDFKMLLDPVKKLGYAHKTDNKKQTVATPSGPADFKVRWEGGKLKREVDTPDTLHVLEEYSLSADGKQLIVTVKADSRMVFNVQNGDIRRVYDRQQQ